MRSFFTLLVVGTLLVGCQPKSRTPQEVKQPDGTVMRLEAVTFGTEHKYQRQSHGTDSPAMVLWISHQGERFDPNQDDYELVCIDARGRQSGFGFQTRYDFRNGSPHGTKIGVWEVPVYPRDQEEFTVQISEYAGGSTNARYHADFTIRNKPVTPAKGWQPMSLPATNRQGDFELVLHDVDVGRWSRSFLQYNGFASGSRGNIPRGEDGSLEHRWTRAIYSFTRAGQREEISHIESIEDPQGNRLAEQVYVEKGFRNPRARHVIGSLPLEQDAWKLTFVRQYKEEHGGARLSFSGIRKPEEGKAYFTNLVATAGGVKIELLKVAGPNTRLQDSTAPGGADYRIVMYVTVPDKNVDVERVSVTDQDGNEIENPFGGISWSTSGAGPYVYNRTIQLKDWPPDVSHLNLSFKPVGKREARFSFMVAPPTKLERRIKPVDPDLHKGDYTATIELLGPDGSRQGGKTYSISYDDSRDRERRILEDNMPADGRLVLNGLAGGSRALRFTMRYEGESVGNFTLTGEGKLQNFTFHLPPGAGDLAPPLPFISLRDAKETSLESYRGQYVFIDFWTTWCGPCQAPMTKANKILARRAKDWEGKAAIISVSLDDGMQKVEEHVQRKRWNEIPHYWVKAGWQSEDVKRFAISGVPTCLLVDPQGKIIWRGHPAAIDIEKKLDELVARAAN